MKRPVEVSRRAVASAAAAVLGALVLAAQTAGADDRLNVCSITINSDDEIETLKRHLPDSQFRFVELTDYARTTSADGEDNWFGRACRSGIRCDVLVLSGHFGNTWAGNYGTTFAGTSGFSLSLEELEQRRCDDSCPGILGSPTEVFLFGCKTLTDTAEVERLRAHDVEVFARHGVSARAAERIVDEVRNRGEGTSSRERMEFVFAGVPRIYGFTDVAPAGKRVAPLLDKYLRTVGDYREHLRHVKTPGGKNDLLARALQPTCYTEARGLETAGIDYSREASTCVLRDERAPLGRRIEQGERLFETADFVGYLPAVDPLVAPARRASYDPGGLAALERMRTNARARAETLALASELETPALRLEIVRVSRALGWLSAEEALLFQRQVAIQLLHPPIWGESRDLICGMGRETLGHLDIRADELSPDVYVNEFGIQALACLKPTDGEITRRLARSLSDPREWIASLAAQALKAMSATDTAQAPALAKQSAALGEAAPIVR